MTEPTEEQIKEFWGWCGLHKHILEEVDYTTEMPFWRCSVCGKRFYTEGYHGRETVGNPLELDIDLNNLFKYAVPRLDKNTTITLDRGFAIPDNRISFDQGATWQEGVFWSCEINEGIYGHCMGENPTLALFWAIYEVIKQ